MLIFNTEHVIAYKPSYRTEYIPTSIHAYVYIPVSISFLDTDYILDTLSRLASILTHIHVTVGPLHI